MKALAALSHIRRLQIKALHHVDDLFAGIYRSAFKGKGLEFEEVREYQTGDEVRLIDWNVTARSNHLFIKNFREERELTVMLVVDISASSQFSHTLQLKSEMIAELAALIAFSAIKNHDKVGLLLFSEEVELYLKPQKGVRHVLRVMRELLYFQPKFRGTDLTKALSFLAKVQKKRVICFLISDFLSGGFEKPVALIAKRHELIAFHIFDSYERSFVPQGLFQLHDLETSHSTLVDTANPLVQQHFKEEAQAADKAIKHLFERLGVSYMAMSTDESAATLLHRFFKLRGRKA